MNNKKLVKLKESNLKKLLSYITNRFFIKLLCLLMSFLLFLFVRYQKEYSKDYITKMDIRNVPSRLMIANNVPENIRVTLKGFRDNIYDLPTEFQAYIDLTNASIGSNMYEVYLTGNIDYSKMNVIVSPNKIPVILDEIAYKTVPIKASIVGKTSIGVTVGDILLQPSNSIISGPKSIISAINEINTYNIDLSDKYIDYSVISRINLPNNVKSDVSRVNVNVIFNKNLEKKEFNDIAINISNLNSKFKVNNSLIVKKVVLEADKSLITNISANDLTLYVNLKQMTNAGIYSNVSVEANIPVNTKLIEIEPSFFDIYVEENKVSSNE